MLARSAVEATPRRGKQFGRWQALTSRQVKRNREKFHCWLTQRKCSRRNRCWLSGNGLCGFLRRVLNVLCVNYAQERERRLSFGDGTLDAESMNTHSTSVCAHLPFPQQLFSRSFFLRHSFLLYLACDERVRFSICGFSKGVEITGHCLV